MAVRIYSLAKELGLDSKALVDLCTRIGILNKGSALASLEEDEVSRVKKHLATAAAPPAAKAAPSASAPSAPSAPLVPERSSTPIGTGGIRQIGRPPSIKRPAASVESVSPKSETKIEPSPIAAIAPSPVSDAPIEPAGQPVAAVSLPVTELTDTEETSGDAASVSPGFTRQDYLLPSGNSTRGVRVIGSRPKVGGDATKPATEERRKRTSSEPIIKLNTRIPKTAAPAAKPVEQAAQKPDIRLTPDMIAGTKQGMTAPLEKLQADSKNAAARGPAAPPPGWRGWRSD